MSSGKSLASFLNNQVHVLVGDITSQTVDAIVNAANSTLLGGGGVDGAIHRRGGPRILEECRRLRSSRFPQGLPPGEAVITTAGDLAAKHVIHTVGPICRGDAEPNAERLAACYRNSLILAAEHNLSSVAFPAISTGVYGYPKEAAARIAVDTLRSTPARVELVRLVAFDTETLRLYEALLPGP